MPSLPHSAVFFGWLDDLDQVEPEMNWLHMKSHSYIAAKQRDVRCNLMDRSISLNGPCSYSAEESSSKSEHFICEDIGMFYLLHVFP